LIAAALQPSATAGVLRVEHDLFALSELYAFSNTNKVTVVWGADGSWSEYSSNVVTRHWVDTSYLVHSGGASIYGTTAEWDMMACPDQYVQNQYVWQTSVEGNVLTLSIPNYNAGWAASLVGISPVSLATINDPYGDLGGAPYVDVLVVTNCETYIRVVDPATREDVSNAVNALVQQYLLTSNAWLTVDWSNKTISVSIIERDVTNVVQVGNSTGIDPAATNLLWSALRAGLAGKAPVAWGEYAPDGTTNPEPDYQLWLNSPATVFASGMSWSTYGSYATLLSTGMVVCTTGSNGYWRISADATNYLGVVQGGSVLVGAVSGSLSVMNGGTPDGWASIVYNYAGGDFPAIEFSPVLGPLASWSYVAGAAWTDNLDGTATVIVPASSSSGFWRGMTSSRYSYTLETTMPFNPRGGIVGATNSAPVIYNSTVTVLGTDGHSYKIPAEREN
jgi:hypothetical protein